MCWQSIHYCILRWSNQLWLAHSFSCTTQLPTIWMTLTRCLSMLSGSRYLGFLKTGLMLFPFHVCSGRFKSGITGPWKKKLVITFDDGYQDFVTNALPILHEHRATATVFLVTGMLGERASWNKSGADERLMSEEDVRSIKAHGISLGSHTATHANLTLLDHKEVRRQLKDSSDKLAQLGETFYAFSYPWGQWTSGIADTVREEGYECALAVGEKTRLIAFNTHCLPRITMGRAIDSKRFQTLLTRTHVEMELRRRFWILRDKWSSLLRWFSSLGVWFPAACSGEIM